MSAPETEAAPAEESHSSRVTRYVKIVGTVIASVGIMGAMLGANVWQAALLRQQVRQLTRIADALEHRNVDTDADGGVR